MTTELERVSIGGVWQWQARSENGGSPPKTTFTVTAAEIVARWDAGVTGAFVELDDTSATGEIVLPWGAVNTLDQGSSLAIYWADSGLTSAQVNAQADLSVAALDMSYVVADGAQSTDPFSSFTVIAAGKAVYLFVGNDEPATGDVTVYIPRIPLVAV